jgi:sec-independent protein translocase protein TatB
MFNIGPGELVVILILALVLLGPKRLPEVARTVGKGMRELRRATEGIKETVEAEFYKLEQADPPKTLLRPAEGRTVPIEPVVSSEPSGEHSAPAAPVATAEPASPASGGAEHDAGPTRPS